MTTVKHSFETNSRLEFNNCLRSVTNIFHVRTQKYGEKIKVRYMRLGVGG